MKVRVEPEAVAELRAAKEWYEERRPGLGIEFVSSFRAMVERIRSTPAAFPLLPGSVDVRRAILEGFPYIAVLLVRGEVVHVLAIAHQRRHPAYLRARAAARSQR